jgi:hypothetical protein
MALTPDDYLKVVVNRIDHFGDINSSRDSQETGGVLPEIYAISIYG